jgi:hypothetical protein
LPIHQNAQEMKGLKLVKIKTDFHEIESRNMDMVKREAVKALSDTSTALP